MNYLKVRWIHSHSDEPVLLYSELDECRWEKRKIEVFADGHAGYASATASAGSTQLGKEPVPPMAKIADDPEFEPSEITRQEFEDVWARYVK
jgi:hypothetical protein